MIVAILEGAPDAGTDERRHPFHMGREVGPWIVGAGIVVALFGVLTWTGALSWFGRLPGDIRITGERGRLYIPITSMLLVSLALTVVLTIFRRR